MRRLRLSTWLFAVAAVLIGYWVYETTDTYAKNAAQERRFFELQEERAEEPERAPLPPPREGDVIGRIDIPAAELSTVVLHGITGATLKQGAGHIPGTALPYEDGNSALAGHRDTFFRGLKGVKAGDEIRLSTLAGDLRYEVTGTEIVGPADVHVLEPTDQPQLTLVTCYPFNYVGAAPKRYIVYARRLAPDADATAEADAADR